jgi:acetyltransferase-like isoleucine patch superfamily enzyme
MPKRIINLILSDPMRIPIYLLGNLYGIWISLKPNIEVKGKLIVNRLPLIDIRKECCLSIGNNVTLNSRNKGYHANLHSPVKIFADKPGAIIKLGDNTRIHGSCIHAHELISIGKNCLIAANCQIFDCNGHNVSFPEIEERINTTGSSKPVIIEDNVWIGINSIILPGVIIGEGTVISANSVVVKDIPSMVVAGGNPAVVIKQ